nr:hypothetical protein CFP56_32456 [Quercus suber]
MASSMHQIVDLADVIRNSSNEDSIVSKFRAFRLHALRTSPEAFASSYEIEVQREPNQSLQRLISPKAAHFIAVNPSADLLSLAEQKWLGMIVLLGPEDQTSSVTVSAQSDPFTRLTLCSSNDESEPKEKLTRVWHYHLNGVFVCPSSRKTGLGTALIQTALGKATSHARSNEVYSISVTVLVDSENKAARYLYETAGFKAMSSERYVQQPRSLVRDESKPKERTAVYMELCLDASEASSRS